MMSYESEGWFLTKKSCNMLNIVEGKVLPRISLLLNIRYERGTWRVCYSHELYVLFNEPKLPDQIKLKSLSCAGYTLGMSKNGLKKRV